VAAAVRPSRLVEKESGRNEQQSCNKQVPMINFMSAFSGGIFVAVKKNLLKNLSKIHSVVFSKMAPHIYI
jgi:hypothetical protein